MLAVHILCVHVQELDLMQSYKQANIFDLTMFQIYINRQKYEYDDPGAKTLVAKLRVCPAMGGSSRPKKAGLQASLIFF